MWTSLTALSPLLTPLAEHESEDHLKGDCQHISVVCRRFLKGLPAACKPRKSFTSVTTVPKDERALHRQKKAAGESKNNMQLSSFQMSFLLPSWMED